LLSDAVYKFAYLLTYTNPDYHPNPNPIHPTDPTNSIKPH